MTNTPLHGTEFEIALAQPTDQSLNCQQMTKLICTCMLLQFQKLTVDSQPMRRQIVFYNSTMYNTNKCARKNSYKKD